MKNFGFLLLSVLMLFSCGTAKKNITGDYKRLQGIEELNGTYFAKGTYLSRLNESERKSSLLSLFKIREDVDFVTIKTDGADKIRLIYQNDSAKMEHLFPGKMKKEYFEIYFSNKRTFIPILYSSFDVERIRIAKSKKDGGLLIEEYDKGTGNLLFFVGGGVWENYHKFPRAEDYGDYRPTPQNGRWGFTASDGNFVVAPEYDFAHIFEKGIARVKQNDKWGLINRQGEKLTDLKYDRILPIDTLGAGPVFWAILQGKEGILDINGKEIIPAVYVDVSRTECPSVYRVVLKGKSGLVDAQNNEILPSIYDEIELKFSRFFSHNLLRIRLGDKWGYADCSKVVIPAIYSEIWSTGAQGGKFMQAKRDGKHYMVDAEGYEYETSGFWIMRDPKYKTKRKIAIEEQEIH